MVRNSPRLLVAMEKGHDYVKSMERSTGGAFSIDAKDPPEASLK